MVIHSHDNDDKSLAPYSQTVDDAAWIYTPLDGNETIAEIWWGSIGSNGDAMGDLFFQYRSGTLFKETSIKSIFKWELEEHLSLGYLQTRYHYGYGGPESLVPNSASLYTPFDNGETVSEVWVGITQNVVGGPGFRTSKGREICHAHAISLHETTWVLADLPRGSERTIYYGSDAPVGVDTFAFRNPAPSGSLGQFDPLGAMPPIPGLRYCVEDFFGGSVDLVGVVEVTCCRLEHKPEITSGMLFRFARDLREALGEGRKAVYLEFGYDHTGVVPERPNLLDARFTMFDEPPEDLNPENHPDIAGHRFLEASWEEIPE
ncbi:uncharacterized protein FTJAE_755 [Fusarium tjaetaba]|uniref:Uncharacterized protein n=1 Tax=Fusarium tjaetaba TaxID=1567544 RepID=A0A8H5SG26_9HYPO|nr:uncharacterized protein FTJAE_755 [Fusarium tjaetaba]KAF5649956.1 hypothetical protein FTJAE_755 [Fusarium tjaetaba]